jgi:hypothetical protein
MEAAEKNSGSASSGTWSRLAQSMMLLLIGPGSV